MRKIREVLRLKFGLGLKDREIARSCSIPRSTVANYVFRATQAGLHTWPLAPDLGDEALEELLFPSRNHKSGSAQGGHTGFRLDA